MQDVRTMHKKYQQSKRRRIEKSSLESLSSAIDALIASLQIDLLLPDARSKVGKQNKERYNRWSSNNDTPNEQRANGEVRLNRDVSPKRPRR